MVERTRIKSLSVRGYRSVRSLDLHDLPEVVVLYGPNGAGKSNVLNAVRLVLRAAAPSVATSREKPSVLMLDVADKVLDLRPDDFAYGELPEIRIRLEVALGAKAREIVSAPADVPFKLLTLEVVFQNPRDRTIRCWFERADVDEQIGVVAGVAAARTHMGEAIEGARAEKHAWIKKMHAPTGAAQLQQQIDTAQAHIRDLDAVIAGYEKRSPEAALIGGLVQTALIPKLLQATPAYRTPADSESPANALYDAFHSEDVREYAAAKSLGRRLSDIGLFGATGGAIELSPVEAKTYNEKQIRLSHPTHGHITLRNLGTGEQQLLFILAQRVVTPYPIAFLEEPEAHLHVSLMAPLARTLRAAVDDDPPDVDQLWIATHHHYFALALEYFDVKLVDGWTTVTKRPRAKAAEHFWEPGPIWEALRQLASSAKEREAVVFLDAAGTPVTAGQVLDSIEKDPVEGVAAEYARAMTEAMVLAMRQRSETNK